MDAETVLENWSRGKRVDAGSAELAYMHKFSQEAMKITCELNYKYHTPEEIIELFSQLIQKPVDSDFGLFPPFYTDC